MNGLQKFLITLGVALLFYSVSFWDIRAQAEDVAYTTIGWWQISYRTVDNLTGCHATAQFNDGTSLQFALIQNDTVKSWTLWVSNPSWKGWVGKRAQHTLSFLTDRKFWRGQFNTADDRETLWAEVSIKFMNSIADANALTIGTQNGHVLTSLSMKNSAAAIRAVVHCFREHQEGAPPAKEQQAQTTTLTGTAFFVADKTVLTNSHVVNQCKSNSIQVAYPDRGSAAATLIGQDTVNDLALLHTGMESLAVASFRSKPRLGEQVATYGFPYLGLLSSSGNFTLGHITSLSGMKDDTRFLQTSAPIQEGNSGSPLMDMSGNVVGVMVSMLNAIAMMQFDQSLPQNVNFAIKTPIVLTFLSTKGISPELAAAPKPDLAPPDLADAAKKFTVQITCQGLPKVVSVKSPSGAASISEYSADSTLSESNSPVGETERWHGSRVVKTANWRRLNPAQ